MGVPVPPLFGLRGTVPLTFQDVKVKKLMSLAANRSDLRRLSYNKTIFGRGSAPDPAERAHDALPDPRVRWEGNTSSPFSSPFASDPRAPHRSPSESVPPLFRPKLRPCIYDSILTTHRSKPPNGTSASFPLSLMPSLSGKMSLYVAYEINIRYPI